MSIVSKAGQLAATTALCAALPAYAADADTSLAIGTILVTAQKSAGPNAPLGAPPTTIDRMGADVVQRTPILYLWQALGQMPGILVTDFNQGTTSGKISLRGFNGEGEVNATKLVIDGSPANSNDGNMPFLDAVFPIELAGIEVVRGTSDARYGLHNIAGNVTLTSRVGGNYADAKLSAGSYGLRDVQAAFGHEAGRFSQNYAAGYQHADGYRAHAGVDKWGVSGRWRYQLAETVRLSLGLRHYQAEAQEPGYLTVDKVRENRRMTNEFNRTDGDQRRIRQANAQVEADLGARAGLVLLAYANQFRDDRYVTFSQGSGQQRRVADEDQFGGQVTVHWAPRVEGMTLRFELGGDVQHQDNVSQRFATQDRSILRQTRDQRFTLDVGGLYVQADLAPVPWLTLRPAYRVDWVGGQFRNQLNASRAPINDYGAIGQPKMSVTLQPDAGTTLYANWGKSYQIGVGSGAYLIPPRQVDLAPSINTGWEAGAKWTDGAGLEARLSAWQQKATGEIKRKLNDPLGDFENVGATRRHGVDVALRFRPWSGLALHGAVSWQKAIITQPDPATPSLKGRELDHVPHWLVTGGADIALTPALKLSLLGEGQSRYWLTASQNGGRWGDRLTAQAQLDWQARPALAVSIALKNLTQDRSAYAWWDGTQVLVSPAQGRSLTLSLRARL